MFSLYCFKWTDTRRQTLITRTGTIYIHTSAHSSRWLTSHAVNGRRKNIYGHKQTHILFTIGRQRLPGGLTHSVVQNHMIFSYFLPFPFVFFPPLMNLSSVRANNSDSSYERADNRAAILTGIKWSGGWWHRRWDTASGRKVKRGRGDAALPSDCKANSETSVTRKQNKSQGWWSE